MKFTIASCKAPLFLDIGDFSPYWPAVVLIIAIVFICVFKKQIADKISSLNEAETKDGHKMKFSENNSPYSASIDEDGESKQLLITDQSDESLIETTGTDESKEEILSYTDLYFLGKYAEASKILQDIISEGNSDTEMSLLKRRLSMIESNLDFDNSVRIMEELISQSPLDHENYDTLAWVYKVHNNLSKSIEVLERGIEAIENPYQLKYTKIEYLIESSSNKRAMEEINSLINSESTPEKWKAKSYFLRSKIKGVNEDQNLTESSLLLAFHHCPTDIQIINALANFYSESSKFGLELFFRIKAHNLQPSVHTWTYLGNCYLMLKLNDLAFTSYENGKNIMQGEDTVLLSNIGNLLNNQGLFSLAEKYLLEALEIDSKMQYAHSRLADALENKNQQAGESNKVYKEAEVSLLAKIKNLTTTSI